jgi:peptidoglycan/LPS O-acetylase OafA/YrhL
MPYLAYIDGLRAIAVLAVLVYHFSRSSLPGGFLGVDIFFVLSGYLITRLLTAPSQLSLGARLADFYVRRARRILPALLVTSLAVAAVALFVYLPDDLVRLGNYLLLTPLMLANVASVQDGGYFSVPTAFLPASHFWSLAVEEQFYIFYPLILLPLIRNTRKSVTTVLVVLALLSMVICIRSELRQGIHAFYYMPARAWELMLGAFAALAPQPWRSSQFATETVAGICVAVLVGSFLLFTPSMALPNPMVTLPCAACAFLLFAGESRQAAAFRALSVPPLVFTGQISYSLYLWHVPILAFCQYYLIWNLTLAELIVLGTLTYLIAVLSWRFVENPVRTKAMLRTDLAFVRVAIVSCVVVSTIGVYLRLSDGLPGRFRRDIAVYAQHTEVPVTEDRCMDLPLEQIEAGKLCHFASELSEAPTAVLWGDSHALALLPALGSLAQSRRLRLLFAGRPSCRPLRAAGENAPSRQAEQGCVAFNDAMRFAIRRIRPSQVILAGFWNEGAREATQAAPGIERPSIADEADWSRIVQPLRAAGSRVCVVLDVPRLRYLVPYTVAMARRRDLDTAFIDLKRADVIAAYASTEAPIRHLAAAGVLRVVDPKDALCARERCDIVAPGGQSLYRDSNHLTRAGAMYVMDTLEPCFQ